MREIIKRNRKALGLPSRHIDVNGYQTLNSKISPIDIFSNSSGWIIADGLIVGNEVEYDVQ